MEKINKIRPGDVIRVGNCRQPLIVTLLTSWDIKTGYAIFDGVYQDGAAALDVECRFDDIRVIDYKPDVIAIISSLGVM